jgi:MFS family permease
MVVASAGTLLLEIVNTTLMQRIVPDAVRGRTLGITHTVSVTGYAAGALILPILAASQPTAALIACGVIVAVSGVIAVVLLGRYAIQEPPTDPIVRKLAEVPMFAGLPPGRIETAMRAATVRQAAAGEVVIRQGDVADNFYVICEGAVEVSQAEDGGATRVLRRMGPAEFFGEIGLLSGVPRTATVAVVEDATLISLPGEAFLELVSGGPGLTYQLLNLHRGATAD